ncbi:MAG: NINE protein [Cyanobacteriota bacterium]|nr:NINE protein [Cyanobacteriota bacterium]
MKSAIPPEPARQPQPPGDLVPAPEGEKLSERQQLRTSYGLWCLALFGLCGLHRLYNRKPLTGLVWLLTFGLCGVGQLADLVLMRKLVEAAAGEEEANTLNPALSAALTPASAPAQPPGRRSFLSRPAKANPAAAATAPPLDLLRERRQQLELEPLSAVLELQPGLIRRGLIIGGLLLGGALGANALLFAFHQTLRNREVQLQGFEREATQLRETINRQGATLQGLRGANQQLVKRLSDVRSSSALLADLQLRVPEGVQVTKVKMLGPNEMELEGLARDPVGFGRVNAMELMLRRSPLFQASGVTINKVERVPAKEFELRPQEGLASGAPVKATTVALPSAVIFTMKATLSPLPPGQLVGVMGSLKAEGMTRRLELLQQEGLLK